MVTLTKKPEPFSYTYEEANKVLYGSEDEVVARFNYDHDTTAFDALRDAQYQDISLAATNTVEFAEPAPVAFTAPAPVTAPAPGLASYYNDKNPIPASSFRPKLYDPALNDMVDSINTHLEKIAEVEVAEEKEAVTKAVATTQTYDATLKLNARGVVAVASFIAVLALVVTLIVINAVNISASAGRIDVLNNDRAVMSQELDQLLTERNQVWSDVTGGIRDQVNSGSLNIGGTEMVQLPPVRPLPNLPTWSPPANPDASTNWFDRVSSWLNNLFR